MTILASALLAAVVAWTGWAGWLRHGYYRKSRDNPQLPMRLSWTSALAAGGIGAVCGIPGWQEITPALILFAGGAGLLMWTDIDVFRIPNAMLRWWGPGVALLALVSASWRSGLEGIAAALISGILVGGFFLIFSLTTKLGMGDTKLAATIGVLLGSWRWELVWPGLAAGTIAGVAIALIAAARAKTFSVKYPYGPALIISVPAAVFIGMI